MVGVTGVEATDILQLPSSAPYFPFSLSTSSDVSVSESDSPDSV